jgi:lipopolysaccharide transport system permease protein
MLKAILNPAGHLAAIGQLTLLLSRHRQLTWEMTKRELQERYAGQALGAFWAIGHPVLMLAIYVFAFAYVFRIRFLDAAGSNLDYTAYLLAGLIPWLAFQDAMHKGAVVVVNSAGLVKQVVFPVEILPLKGVLASTFTEVIALACLLIYSAFKQSAFLWTWLLLPLLVVCQALAMTGVCYVLAAFGTFFRDVKDIVILFTTAGLYLMPVLYTPGLVPGKMEALFYLNPFSYMVWCYQDAAFYGRFVHPLAWFVYPLLSLGCFYVGYRVFRKLRPLFGNVL